MPRPSPQRRNLCRRSCTEQGPDKRRRDQAEEAMQYCALRQRSYSSLRNHLPPAARGIEISPKQPLKQRHCRTRCRRSILPRPRADVADQLLTAQNDQAAIQIEERKSGAGYKLGCVTSVAQKELN